MINIRKYGEEKGGISLSLPNTITDLLIQVNEHLFKGKKKFDELGLFNDADFQVVDINALEHNRVYYAKVLEQDD